jgi:hypothetical protein
MTTNTTTDSTFAYIGQIAAAVEHTLEQLEAGDLPAGSMFSKLSARLAEVREVRAGNNGPVATALLDHLHDRLDRALITAGWPAFIEPGATQHYLSNTASHIATSPTPFQVLLFWAAGANQDLLERSAGFGLVRTARTKLQTALTVIHRHLVLDDELLDQGIPAVKLEDTFSGSDLQDLLGHLGSLASHTPEAGEQAKLVLPQTHDGASVAFAPLRDGTVQIFMLPSRRNARLIAHEDPMSLSDAVRQGKRFFDS